MTPNHINILLADDDSDDCRFFEIALKEMPVSTHLTSVPDGEKIMEFLLNEPNPVPDVIFLDLNMPRKNGFECVLEIKANPKLKHIPVFIFSTSLEEEIVRLLYADGANYFIRKPSEFLHFRKIIEHLLLNHVATGDTKQPPIEDFVITATTLKFN